jgi:hypothetical protein
MDGYAGCDKADGVGCGLVEFTLINPGGLGLQLALLSFK